MKYRIEGPDETYEAEKTPEEFQDWENKRIAGETEEYWHPIDRWSKKHPIL